MAGLVLSLSACGGAAASGGQGPTLEVRQPAATTASPTQPVAPTAPPTLRPVSSPTRAATRTSAATATLSVVKVVVGEYFFEPQVVTITVGTTLVWAPAGDRPHTIVSVDGERVLRGSVGDAGSPPFEFTFQQPGVYAYTCDVHPGVMDGFVVVVEGN